jgi:hypothetical protein
LARPKIEDLNWEILEMEEGYEIVRDEYKCNQVGLEY